MYVSTLINDSKLINFQDTFDARLTLRCQISIVSIIRKKLTPEQLVIFRGTCFGVWLDLMCPDNDPGYVHYML